MRYTRIPSLYLMCISFPVETGPILALFIYYDTCKRIFRLELFQGKTNFCYLSLKALTIFHFSNDSLRLNS